MTRSAIAILVVLAALFAFVACGRGAGASGPLPTPEPGTSLVRFEAPNGAVLDAIRAPILPDGSLGTWQFHWAYIGPLEPAPGGALDRVLEPGYLHFVSCGIPLPVGDDGYWPVYLPVTVRGFRRWEWLLR